MAVWLAAQVGESGKVVATDIDVIYLKRLRLPNLEVRQHNILTDSLDTLGPGAQGPSIRRSRAARGALLASALVLLSTIRSSATEPPNALVPMTVEVPLSLRTTPFDEDRVLMVPPGFKISVVARIPLARFIMPLSAGDILVATPSDGTISLVQIQPDGTATVSSLIEDLHNPHGMALHRSDDKLYLYVAESNQVSRVFPVRIEFH
jgi:hypothetical protein